MTTLKARAKINLFFHITGKREDGYHLIDSLTVFAEDIFDLIDINESDYSKTIVKDGEFASHLKKEENNLIDKAIEIFSNKKKYNCVLTKNIPIAAGLGGGSSDAATVARYIDSSIDTVNLLKIGADLPICYYNQPAYCEGIGEIIHPIEKFPTIYLVLVNPQKALLTKEVFKLNKINNTPPIHNKPSNFFYSPEKLIEFLSNLGNDLTDSAISIMPEIKSILDMLQFQKGCKFSRMSGSGPTCFGLFDNEKEAIDARDILVKQKPQYWVKHTAINK